MCHYLLYNIWVPNYWNKTIKYLYIHVIIVYLFFFYPFVLCNSATQIKEKIHAYHTSVEPLIVLLIFAADSYEMGKQRITEELGSSQESVRILTKYVCLYIIYIYTLKIIDSKNHWRACIVLVRRKLRSGETCAVKHSHISILIFS